MKQVVYLPKSQSTANYLLALVNDTLDISKRQSGRIDLGKKPPNIETVLDDI